MTCPASVGCIRNSTFPATYLLEDRAKCKVEDRIRTHQKSHICPFNGNMACLNWEIWSIYGMSYILKDRRMGGELSYTVRVMC